MGEPRGRSAAGLLYTLGGLFGYLLVGFLAERLGRRPTAATFFAGAFLITPVLFWWVRDCRTRCGRSVANPRSECGSSFIRDSSRATDAEDHG